MDLSLTSRSEIDALLDRALQEQVAPYLSWFSGRLNPSASYSSPDSISSLFSSLTTQSTFIHSKSKNHPFFKTSSFLSSSLDVDLSDGFYDLASLTKPMATALWFWTLDSSQSLDRFAPIQTWIECADPLLGQCPLWRLTNHSSGLPAHFKYYEGLGKNRLRGMDPQHLKQRVRGMISQTPLQVLPGEKSIYSDLGYLLLEWICECVSGESLEHFWERTQSNLNAFFGTDLFQAHFNPLKSLPKTSIFDSPTPHPQSHLLYPSSHYMPTEQCPWRTYILQGEVHDDNSWLMGGITGHAGLFGRLSDVVLWCTGFLSAFHGRDNPFGLSSSYLREICDYQWRNSKGGSFVLGWDTPSVGYSSAGSKLGPWAVGHLGFTGTSIWMDLEQEIIMILLSNRVCPKRTGGQGIRWLRPALHDAAWLELAQSDPTLKSRS